MQESRNIESAEEGLFGIIAEWLDRPVPINALSGSTDSRFDDDENEPMAIRIRTCLTEIWQDCLQRDLGAYNAPQAQLLGRAVGQLREWRDGPACACRSGGGNAL